MSQEAKVIAEGRHISMLNLNGWEYVDRPKPSGLVCITAVNDRDELILVEQFRPPVRTTVIELPAGLVGDVPGEENESLELGARRELLEETGYEADSWKLVASGPPSAGLATEVLNLFVATGLRRIGEGGGDASENISVHEVPLASLHEWLAQQSERGAMIDLKIFSGLYFLKQTL
ncbi:MAG: NUDIX hydrolase [Planctomycetota bacterium]